MIENYVAEQYVQLGIKCFRCGHVSYTPEIEIGEIFTTYNVSLGEEGDYRVEGTVEFPSGALFINSAQLRAGMALTQPVDHHPPFRVNEDGLDDLCRAYDSFGRASVAEQTAILQRAPAKFRDALTFSWAIHTLREAMQAGSLNLGDANVNRAFLYAHLFHRSFMRWRHHPRFAAVAEGFAKPGSFLHTAGMFVFAEMMHAAGTSIGLALEDRHGEPNPDLYIRHAPEGRVYLEVKAPLALQNITDRDDGWAVEATTKQIVDRLKTQINKNRKGALIIFATGFRDGLHAEMERYSENVMKRVGRNRTSLAAIITMTLTGASFERLSDGAGQYHADFCPGLALNPHFAGKNPFVGKEPSARLRT